MLMATGPVVKVNRPELNTFGRGKLIITALKLYKFNPALEGLRSLIFNALSLTSKSKTG